MDSKLSKEELNMKMIFNDDDRFTYVGSEGTTKVNFKLAEMKINV